MATGGGSKGGARSSNSLGIGFGANPMTNASRGMTAAFDQTKDAMRANQSMYQGADQFQYDPTMMQAAQSGAYTMGGAPQYTAATGTGATYNPSMMGSSQYTANMQSQPGTLASLMDGYRNKFTNDVINRTTSNMQRDAQLAQNNIGADAVAAGAFGGGRHGIAEAVARAETNRNIGDMTAGLNLESWNNAAGMAGTDIANQMAVAAANQNAANQAGQFNAGQRQQAGMYNADAKNNAGQFNAGNRQQMTLANMDSRNQAGQFNAGMQMDRNMANMNAINAMRSQNLGNRQQANMANADAANTAAQFNSGTMQDVINNFISNQGNIGGQFGNLAQASYGIGSNINQQQMQAGGLAQALRQQILDNGQNMFQGYTGTPMDILNTYLTSVGANPMSGAGTTTQTQTTNPGFGQILGNLLQAGGNMFSFNPIDLPFG